MMTKKRYLKVNVQPQSNLENAFPILLDNRDNVFKENYASMLRFIAVNELIIEIIDDYKDDKRCKQLIKKQCNLIQEIAIDTCGKFFPNAQLLDDYDKLNENILENIREYISHLDVVLKLYFINQIYINCINDLQNRKSLFKINYLQNSIKLNDLIRSQITSKLIDLEIYDKIEKEINCIIANELTRKI